MGVKTAVDKLPPAILPSAPVLRFDKVSKAGALPNMAYNHFSVRLAFFYIIKCDYLKLHSVFTLNACQS